MKSFKLKVSSIIYALLFAGFVCFNVTGCQNPVETNTDEVSILGKWQGSYGDTYEIGSDVVSSSYGTHKGTVYVTKTSETSGYVYYQFDHDITAYGGADTDYAPYTLEGSKGKWSAIYYENLMENSVCFSEAYKADSAYDFPSTLEDVKKLYTYTNGYFWPVEVTRVTE